MTYGILISICDIIFLVIVSFGIKSFAGIQVGNKSMVVNCKITLQISPTVELWLRLVVIHRSPVTRV